MSGASQTRKFKDNAQTTLASSITALSTTLSVLAGKGDNFPTLTGRGVAGSNPEFSVITLEDSAGNRERIKVEQRAAGSDVLGSGGYPLIRGYGGSAARAWNAGDTVDLRWGADDAEDDNDKSQADGPARDFGHRGSTTTGLTFGYFGAQLNVDGVPTTVAGGTLVLTASLTNYVQRTPSGVVSFNTTGFDADKIPLYQVSTDTGGITAITDMRAGNLNTYGFASKSVAAGGTITLTADEARAPGLELTGALPNNTSIVFPNVKRTWVLRNNTTGAFSLTAKVSGQPGVAVGAGEVLVYCNGTDIRAVLSDALTALAVAATSILNQRDFYQRQFLFGTTF